MSNWTIQVGKFPVLRIGGHITIAVFDGNGVFVRNFLISLLLCISSSRVYAENNENVRSICSKLSPKRNTGYTYIVQHDARMSGRLFNENEIENLESSVKVSPGLYINSVFEVMVIPQTGKSSKFQLLEICNKAAGWVCTSQIRSRNQENYELFPTDKDNEGKKTFSVIPVFKTELNEQRSQKSPDLVIVHSASPLANAVYQSKNSLPFSQLRTLFFPRDAFLFEKCPNLTGE